MKTSGLLGLFLGCVSTLAQNGADTFPLSAETNWDGRVNDSSSSAQPSGSGKATNETVMAGSGQPPAYSWVTNLNGDVQTLTNLAAIQVFQPRVKLRPHVEITADGALAVGGAFTLKIDGNLNHPDAIEIFPPGTDPDSKTANSLKLHMVAIGASDPVSGKRIWLGQVQDSTGVVLEGEPCKILWTNAVAGLNADIVLQYNANSIIQDVYLRAPITLPPDSGIDPDTMRLEVWSEVYAGAKPSQSVQTISLTTSGNSLNSQPSQPLKPGKQATDVSLDWGTMKMVAGKAFRVNSSESQDGSENWPVAKQWVTNEDRAFVVETVDYGAIKTALENHKSASHRPTQPLISSESTNSEYAALPRHTNGVSKAMPNTLGAAIPRSNSIRPKSSKTLLAKWDARQTAEWNQIPGAIIDWTLVNGLLLNVNFGGTTHKIGPAAVGKDTADYWNRYHYARSADSTLTNLQYADQTASSVSVRVQNAPGEWGNSSGDPMFDSYIYNYPSNGNITVTIQNLPTGAYDIYVYGHGAADSQNASYTLYGITKNTAAGPYWNTNQLASGNFVENTHYVVFHNVSATNGGTTVITASATTTGGYVMFNGIQVAAIGNMPPVLNAGTNQSITFPATTTLSGNATDDGLPAGSSIHLSWSKVSGPGTVSFNPADGTGTNLASTATFSAPGAYVLNFTGDDGDRTNSSSVVVVVNASPEIQDIVWCEDSLPYGATAYAEPEPWSWISSNPPPYAGIKAHQSSIYSGLHQHYFGGALPPISLQASNLLYAYVYIDPANPPLEVMLQWHATDTTGWYDHRAYWSAGPNYMWAGVRVGDLPTAGTWTRLEIDAGSVGLSGRDIDGVAFSLYGGRATWDHAGVVKFATNNVPTVTAGADIGVSISEAATLQGFASDDGLPAMPGLAATWSQISGPGTATFGNLHATNTTVTFDVAGEYVLRLIADDSELSAFDEVNVTVHHAFANDPVAWWQFNETSGSTALDSSGYGHTGMIFGTPDRIAGKVGNALQFDGTDDWVTIPDAADLHLTGDMSLALWVNPARLETNAWILLVGKGDSSSPAREFELWIEPVTGQLVFKQGDNTGQQINLYSSQALPLNRWTHVLVTVQGNVVRLFLNGSLDATGTRVGAPLATSWPVTLGHRNNYAYFQGAIDEVRLYGRAISNFEIQTLSTLDVPADNYPPTLSNIPNQIASAGSRCGPIDFTVDDDFTPAQSLGITVVSGSPALVPNTVTNLVLGGSGNCRTLTVYPGSDQSGTASITVTVNDGFTAVSQSFTITYLPALRLCLRADMGITNASVDRWRDQTTNHFDIIQATAAYQPQWVTNAVNGLPAVRFDGVNDVMTSSSLLTGVTNAEAFIVLKAASATPSSSQGLWRVGRDTYTYYPEPSGQLQDGFASTTLHLIGKPAQAVDQFHIYNVASKNGLWQARINGVLQTIDANNAFSTSSTLYLGCAGSSYFTGDIAEVLVFNRSLGDEERTTVGLYLNSRYGLVAAAPAVPSHLQAQGISTNQINLTWNFDLNATSTRFVIERKDTASASFNGVATVRDALGYLDTGLVAASSYTYRIKAVNDAGESAYTPETTVFTLTNGLAIPMANLKLWLRADCGTAGAGTNRFLNRWLDQSGNGNHANQSTLAYAPLWVASATNGRPAVRFDGVNDSLSIPNVLSGATNAEVFVVLKVASRYPTAGKALWRYGTSSTYTYYPDTGGAIKDDFASSTLHNVGVPTQPLDQFHIYDAVSAAGLWQARINGILQKNDTNNVFSVLSTFTLGSSYSYFAGDVAEIMIFNRKLEDGERLSTQMFLAYKYFGDGDDDDDGLTDAWEQLYFGNMNSDSFGDWDCDGLTNLEEQQGGSNPTDALGLQVFTPLD